MRNLSAAALICLFAFQASLWPASAREPAAFKNVGFSSDGRYYAFYEYDHLHGAGLDYAKLFVVNVAENAWVSGANRTFEIESDTSLTNKAHQALLNELFNSIDSYQITPGTGEWVVSNPLAELSNDPSSARFYPSNDLFQDGPALEIRLHQSSIFVSHCAAVNLDGLLLRAELHTPQRSYTLQEDTRLPASRGCPENYRLFGVITHQNDDGTLSIAAVVSMRRAGFEGPATRYMVVTTRIEHPN